MECKDCVHNEQFKRDIARLENELECLKKQMLGMEIAIARGDEQTKTLFTILGEIKDSVEMIALEMREIRERPDPFKETVYGYGLKILEKAIIGGIIVWLLTSIE